MEKLGAVLRRYDHWRTERFLDGRKFMSPGLGNQRLWARTLAPHLSLEGGEDSWDVLARFTLPLVDKLASSAHVRGVRLLDLGRPPELAALSRHLCGWTVTKVDGEVPSRRFFSLLSRRIFPSVASVRPLDEVFCGSAPDLWHEAVGHLAPLTDPAYADFYQWCGEKVGELYSIDPARARRLEKILWVVLEYGFIKEPGGLKSFGAALSGSFMGLKRFEGGYLAHRPFDPESVLRSGLYEEGHPAPRDSAGRILFFALDSLDAAKRAIDGGC